MSETDDTVFALSTVPGRSGVAVLRVSGPAAGRAIEALSGRPLPPPRRASLRDLADPGSGAAIDRALVLWFPGPGSFTGEDMAEFHLHGGPAVVAAAVEALGALAGLTPAEPGDFSRRAFRNGKLDLSEVEGLADLIDAETEAQRRQALAQMGGALSRLTEGWRERLVGVLARMEAAIDFPDEELPAGLVGEVLGEAGALEREIAELLDDGHRGERLRDGLSVAILGPPNSGKSSLMNRMARRDVAIVSDTAGTTRDVIEVHLDLGGYPVTLADTAGLRDLAGDGDPGAAIEREGMVRARRAAERADLVLAVFDGTAWPELDATAGRLVDERALVVLNKSDLWPSEASTPEAVSGRPALPVSAKTGAGFDRLLEVLTAEAAARLATRGGGAAITRVRHRAALEDCRDALARAGRAEQVDLVAEDLRLAARALARVAGRVDVEDLLDRIFREFCIGK